MTSAGVLNWGEGYSRGKLWHVKGKFLVGNSKLILDLRSWYQAVIIEHVLCDFMPVLATNRCMFFLVSTV